MRPFREWTIVGRPLGEWLFLALMAFQGLNALNELWTQHPHGNAEWLLFALRLTSSVAALGVVAGTLAGRELGIRALWLFAMSATASAPLYAASLQNAPLLELMASVVGAATVCGIIVWYGSRRLHASITQRQWPALLADHAAAADEFVAAIDGMTETEWSTRPSPEAWSAAELTEHLARTYSQYAGEARGKNSLRIRLGPVPRTIARLFFKPRLLAGGAFPKAKAPRTLRPSGGPQTPADGVALFRATGDACLRDLGMLAERRPYRKLVHPYFGALPLYEALRFASQHVRHHRRQLPSAALPHTVSPENR